MSEAGIVQMRVRAALESLFVADALAMPLHWFYNPRDIQAAFPGGVAGFEAPPVYHPSSIMSLHSTRQGGRGQQSAGTGEIVGDVILKGKRQFWSKPGQHYHQGMAAGENTLNAHCARVLMRSLAACDGQYDRDDFLQCYIDFMTSQVPRHPDTYAESCHRAFFANLQAGRPPHLCGGVTHDTPSVGGLVMIAPLAMALLLQGHKVHQVQAMARSHLVLTHPDESLASIADALVQLISDLMFRQPTAPVAPALLRAAKALGGSPGLDLQALDTQVRQDAEVVGGLFSTACYISDAWPSVLFLAYRYADSPRQGLLANANLGGDNVHRGAVLGALLSLACGETLQDLYGRLQDTLAISSEIDALLACAA